MYFNSQVSLLLVTIALITRVLAVAAMHTTSLTSAKLKSDNPGGATTFVNINGAARPLISSSTPTRLPYPSLLVLSLLRRLLFARP